MPSKVMQMTKLKFEMVLTEIIDSPIYRAIVVPTLFYDNIDELIPLWREHGIGICWSYNQNYVPRKYDFHPQINYIFLIFQVILNDSSILDFEMTKKLYLDPNWSSEKEVRLNAEKKVRIESIILLDPFESQRSEIYINEQFSTGKVWFQDKTQKNAGVQNPYLHLFGNEPIVSVYASNHKSNKVSEIWSFLRGKFGKGD